MGEAFQCSSSRAGDEQQAEIRRLKAELKRVSEERDILKKSTTYFARQSWLESGSIYGYRKVWQDLRELGEGCGINRVHRLMR